MGDADRFRDDGSTIRAWAEPEVLVECPRCGERAVVRRAGGGTQRRLTCLHCGLARTTSGATSSWGRPVDPWFGLALWLQAEFRGHTVWAFNAGHVRQLRGFVAAERRERAPTAGAPMSMLEELPGWMTAAGHRQPLLAVLDRLPERTADQH